MLYLGCVVELLGFFGVGFVRVVVFIRLGYFCGVM